MLFHADEVATIQRLRPDITLIIGGPEVSHEHDTQPICAIADYVVTGEADLTFPTLCRDILAERRPISKMIFSGPPDTNQIALPYRLYTEEDVRNRVIYVEGSRAFHLPASSVYLHSTST